jgi:NTE family protein
MTATKPTTKKALVLSGGGGRGAYHIGVFEALIEQGWMADGGAPDIIAGTSIGAINAAALASGHTINELKNFWLGMRTEKVHRLSDDLPLVTRPLLRFLLRSVLTSGPLDDAQTLPDAERNMSAQGLFSRLATLFHARPFRSLLDTTPWRQTLSRWIDIERINSPAAPALLLAATELQSGTLRVFSNRRLRDPQTEVYTEPDVITLDHLMASASIPIVYPWTAIDQGKYWDGAVLANTPLEPVLDLAYAEGDSDVDILVVMMTPWNADPAAIRAQTRQLPEDLVQALSLTLDWTLLASYRVAFEMLEHRNHLAEAAIKLRRAAQQMSDDSLLLTGRSFRPVALPTVIAPEQLMPLDWIIDYEPVNHQTLFKMGRDDALKALRDRAKARP